MTLREQLNFISIGNPVVVVNYNSPMGRLFPREVAKIDEEGAKHGITAKMLEADVVHIYTESQPTPMYEGNPIIIQIDWLKKNNIETKKKIICRNTGKVFNSISEAANFYELSYSNVRRAIEVNGKANGYEFIEIETEEL